MATAAAAAVATAAEADEPVGEPVGEMVGSVGMEGSVAVREETEGWVEKVEEREVLAGKAAPEEGPEQL